MKQLKKTLNILLKIITFIFPAPPELYTPLPSIKKIKEISNRTGLSEDYLRAYFVGISRESASRGRELYEGML